MMRWLSETVQHEKFTGVTKDAKNNDVPSWGDPVDLGIYAFNPGGTSEPFTAGHDARVVSQPSMFVPSGTVIGARDKVTVRGVTYEVDGAPLDFRNPYGSVMDGLEVKLKAVTG